MITVARIIRVVDACRAQVLVHHLTVQEPGQRSTTATDRGRDRIDTGLATRDQLPASSTPQA